MRDRLGQVTAFRVDAMQSAPRPSLQSSDSSEASTGAHTVATSQLATSPQ
jgi:hypothetical protein